MYVHVTGTAVVFDKRLELGELGFGAEYVGAGAGAGAGAGGVQLGVREGRKDESATAIY